MMFEATPDAWLVRARGAEAPFRLVCFPYAGAGASVYYPWARALDGRADVAIVQLPGRESRVSEALLRDHSAMARGIAGTIARLPPKPMIFFGHSFGSLLAYETALALAAANGPMPVGLVASGRSSPLQPPRRENVADLPEKAFFAHLRRLGGLPDELFKHPELLAFYEPILRADLRVNERYVHSGGEQRLDVPLLALAGRSDEDFPAECVEDWRRVTRGPFSMTTFDSGHFFIHDHREEVLKTVLDFAYNLLQLSPSGRDGAATAFLQTKQAL